MAADWNPNGKYIAVIMKMCDIQVVAIDGSVVRSYEKPQLADDLNVMQGIYIRHLSHTEALMVYAASRDDCKVAILCIAEDAKKNDTYTVFDSLLYSSFTSEREPSIFFASLTDWPIDTPHIVLLASASSSETMILAKCNGQWQVWELNDDDKAVLPSKDVNEHETMDLTPVGLAFDMTSTQELPPLNPELSVEKTPAMPIVYILTDDGTICAWNCFHLKAIEQKQVYPHMQQQPLPLIATSVLSTATASSKTKDRTIQEAQIPSQSETTTTIPLRTAITAGMQQPQIVRSQQPLSSDPMQLGNIKLNASVIQPPTFSSSSTFRNLSTAPAAKLKPVLESKNKQSSTSSILFVTGSKPIFELPNTIQAAPPALQARLFSPEKISLEPHKRVVSASVHTPFKESSTCRPATPSYKINKANALAECFNTISDICSAELVELDTLGEHVSTEIARKGVDSNALPVTNFNNSSEITNALSILETQISTQANKIATVREQVRLLLSDAKKAQTKMDEIKTICDRGGHSDTTSMQLGPEQYAGKVKLDRAIKLAQVNIKYLETSLLRMWRQVLDVKQGRATTVPQPKAISIYKTLHSMRSGIDSQRMKVDRLTTDMSKMTLINPNNTADEAVSSQPREVTTRNQRQVLAANILKTLGHSKRSAMRTKDPMDAAFAKQKTQAKASTGSNKSTFSMLASPQFTPDVSALDLPTGGTDVNSTFSNISSTSTTTIASHAEHAQNSTLPSVFNTQQPTFSANINTFGTYSSQITVEKSTPILLFGSSFTASAPVSFNSNFSGLTAVTMPPKLTESTIHHAPPSSPPTKITSANLLDKKNAIAQENNPGEINQVPNVHSQTDQEGSDHEEENEEERSDESANSSYDEITKQDIPQESVFSRLGSRAIDSEFEDEDKEKELEETVKSEDTGQDSSEIEEEEGRGEASPTPMPRPERSPSTSKKQIIGNATSTTEVSSEPTIPVVDSNSMSADMTANKQPDQETAPSNESNDNVYTDMITEEIVVKPTLIANMGTSFQGFQIGSLKESPFTATAPLPFGVIPPAANANLMNMQSTVAIAAPKAFGQSVSGNGFGVFATSTPSKPISSFGGFTAPTFGSPSNSLSSTPLASTTQAHSTFGLQSSFASQSPTNTSGGLFGQSSVLRQGNSFGTPSRLGFGASPMVTTPMRATSFGAIASTPTATFGASGFNMSANQDNPSFGSGFGSTQRGSGFAALASPAAGQSPFANTAFDSSSNTTSSAGNSTPSQFKGDAFMQMR